MTYFEGKQSYPRLNRKDAAVYLGVAPSTLAVWSCTGRYNLPYVKVGRLVQYRIADLDHFISSRTVCGEVLQ